MIVLIFFSLLAILLTYQESTGKMKYGMLYGFIFLWLIYAIRDQYGTDFDNYYYNFHSNARLSFGQILKEPEPGWALLNKLFEPLGFYWFSSFVGFVICYSVYFFIKNNLPLKNRVFAVFVFTFTSSLYPLSFSMMRQSFAMAIFLFIWKYVERRQFTKTIALLLAACTIHTSSVVLFFVLFVFRLNQNNIKIFSSIAVILFIAFFMSVEFMGDILTSVLSLDIFTAYVLEHGNREGSSSYGIGFALITLPMAISLIQLYRKAIPAPYLGLVVISCIGTLLMPFGKINNLIIRISYYFTIYTIVSIPLVYSTVVNRMLKKMFIFLYILVTIVSYYRFFTDPVFSGKYLVYHSIFENL